MSDGPASPPLPALSAREALAAPENVQARARRLAAGVRDVAASVERRIDILNLLLAVHPDAARQVALDAVADEDDRLRDAATSVVASTRGSSDDNERLTSLLARPDLTPQQRRNLAAAVEGIRSPSPEDTLMSLAVALEAAITRSEMRADLLIPVPDRIAGFLTLADCVRSRARRPEVELGFIEAAAELCSQMVDLVVLAADGVEPLPQTDSEEVAAIRHSLPGRPDIEELLSRRGLRMRFPWFAACVVLRDHLGRVPESRAESEEMATVCRRLLAEALTGWVRDMHGLHWAARSLGPDAQRTI